MKNEDNPDIKKLTEHLFRIEYGKIVSVITKYLGVDNLKIAEDITQDTFYKAVKYWQHNGLPPNPQAWLYVTAKNECLNKLKKRHLQSDYQKESRRFNLEIEDMVFSDQVIADEQLRMMFVCCHDSISEDAQLSLILKILCGFSISEIASAFFTSTETINKRLVRARKRLRQTEDSLKLEVNFDNKLPTILQAIYLLFNEGYSPSEKNTLIRKELCFEAIRLAECLKDNSKVTNKNSCYSLLSLMYFNVSRFDSRLTESGEAIEMKNQDRRQWNQKLINKGLFYLNKVHENKTVSMYQILAAISANHCTASNFESTNWVEILSLYDSLLAIVDSPVIRLNRSVALSKVKGSRVAIKELNQLNSTTDIANYHLFHATIAEFHIEGSEFDKAAQHLHKAISLTKNSRDINLFEKKLSKLVPI